MRKKNILVTGASGFLAGHLLPALRNEGYELTRCSRNKTITDGVVGPGLNMLDPEGLDRFFSREKFDFVLHMAAISNPRHTPVFDIYETNVLCLKNLLSALARQKGCRERFYFFSSSHIYGKYQELPIDECTIPNPQSDYALSKYIGEQICEIYSKQIPITILRLFNIIGRDQGDDFVAGKLSKAFMDKASSLSLKNVTDIRDFMDVRDFTGVISRLLKCDPDELVLNVCQERATSIQDLVNEFVLASGHRPKIKIDTANLVVPATTLLGSKKKLEAHIGVTRPLPIQATVQWMCEDSS